jgi:hypothetical protein
MWSGKKKKSYEVVSARNEWRNVNEAESEERGLLYEPIIS